jgi:hypothetical protein
MLLNKIKKGLVLGLGLLSLYGCNVEENLPGCSSNNDCRYSRVCNVETRECVNPGDEDIVEVIDNYELEEGTESYEFEEDEQRVCSPDGIIQNENDEYQYPNYTCPLACRTEFCFLEDYFDNASKSNSLWDFNSTGPNSSYNITQKVIKLDNYSVENKELMSLKEMALIYLSWRTTEENVQFNMYVNDLSVPLFADGSQEWNKRYVFLKSYEITVRDNDAPLGRIVGQQIDPQLKIRFECESTGSGYCALDYVIMESKYLN